MWGRLAVAVLVLAAGSIASTTQETCSNEEESCAAVDSVIPTVDLLKVKTERAQQADVLIKALEGVGFIYIDNIEGFDNEEILRVTKWFFSQSLEKKMAMAKKTWNPKCDNVFRGYYPRVPNAVPVSNKEAVEFGMDKQPENYSHVIYELNPWPSDDGPAFRSTVEKYRDIFARTAAEIIHLLAVGIGLHENAFDAAFSYAPLSTFRFLHYPPRDYDDVPEMARDGDRIIQCADHKDTSFVTLLATFSNTGLELLDEEGNWAAVTPRPNSLVMNIGRLLSEMSGDRFKATGHRVMDPGIDRYSVAFFFEPHARTDVNVTLAELGQDIERPASHKPELYANWMVTRTKVFYEYRDTDFGPELV